MSAIQAPLRNLAAPGYVVGRWYGPLILSSAANIAIVADTVYAHPVYIGAPVGIDQLGITVGTAVAATSAKLGIYASGSDGLPGALLAAPAGEGDMNSGANTAISLSLAATLRVGPGWVWLASIFSGIAQPYTFSNAALSGGGIGALLGASSAGGVARAGTAPNTRLTRTATQAYASGMPATFGASTAGASTPGAPIVAFRVAA